LFIAKEFASLSFVEYHFLGGWFQGKIIHGIFHQCKSFNMIDMIFCLGLSKEWRKCLYLEVLNHIILALYLLIIGCQGEVSILLFLSCISWMTSGSLVI
jgi:hypothetical protein